MICKRSLFDVMIDILIVFYEDKSFNADHVIRRANLCNNYQKEVIDLLITNGLVFINDKNLCLTITGESVVGEIVPGLKKAKFLFNKI